ncbi:MAG: phosphotransferase family protein [Actinobacteria bacterium]|nr:phosphotransferase family protein [Actinomycetota bacterium]
MNSLAADSELAEQIRGALGRAAAGDPAGAAALIELSRMSGGHSGVTHLAVLRDADRRERRLVVKSAPVGRPARGRHDVLRQARVVEALGADGSVPVAGVRLRGDGDPPFYAADLLPGVATEPLIEPPQAEESGALIAARWQAALDVIARLHALDSAAIGLAGEPVRTPAAELAIWTRTMEAARFDHPAATELPALMLAAAPPAPARPAIVHGDFRLGNILFVGAEPQGLIDWEIWSVGDPLVDLGWFYSFTDPANYPGLGRDVPGTPTADDLVAAYLEVTDQTDRDPSWFLALGCFKLAAIQAHNRKRSLDGRHVDAANEALGPSIERLLDRALATLA